MVKDAKVKIKFPKELNDGHGSYICKYGHVHDYSEFDVAAVEREIADPRTAIYENTDDMWADLDAEDEDGEV